MTWRLSVAPSARIDGALAVYVAMLSSAPASCLLSYFKHRMEELVSIVDDVQTSPESLVKKAIFCRLFSVLLVQIGIEPVKNELNVAFCSCPTIGEFQIRINVNYYTNRLETKSCRILPLT